MVNNSPTFELTEPAPGHFLLSGELSFDSVGKALKLTAKMFLVPAKVTIDLGGIERADSAGLALMIEWMRRAREGGASLKFANIPEQLLAMARVAGVDQIITHG
jgi:phospholipid transport system transporter-binding protein